MRNVKELVEYCDNEFAKLGLTRYAALKKLGFSQPLFKEALKRNSLFKIEVICKLAEFIGVSVDTLLGLEEPNITVSPDVRRIMDNQNVMSLALKLLGVKPKDLCHIEALTDSYLNSYES